MKKLLFVFVFFTFSIMTEAQLVRFNSVNYYVGDEVMAEIISGTGFIVENDITKSSQNMVTGGNNVSLGRITAPGFFRLHFRFSATLTETYYVLAGNREDDITNVSSKKLTVIVSETATVTEVFKKLTENYSKLEWKEIAQESLLEFAKTHAVSGTITVTVCLSSGTVPAFVPVCLGNVKTEFKDLTVIVIKKMAENMYSKNIISEDQKKKFIKVVDGLNNVLDFFSAKGKLDKLITAGAIATDYSTDNETMKLLIQQQKQLYDQTKILIEFSRKNP